MKKRGGKRMPSTAKVIDFSVRSTSPKVNKFTQVKPIKKLSKEDTKASQKFITDSWEKD